MDFISDDEYRQMATNSAQNDAKEAIIKNEELEKRIELLERQIKFLVHTLLLELAPFGQNLKDIPTE